MKIKDFSIIENELHITLPYEYKEAVLTNPFNEKKYANVRHSLFTDVDTILLYNKKMQKNKYYNKNWPKQYFIIGAPRENTYYIIDLKKKDKHNIYGVMEEDQKNESTTIKKISVGSNFNIFIDNIKLVSDC